MLELSIPIVSEKWDENKQQFIPPIIKTINLEHSLISLSKWESKWHKAFLSKNDKTNEEILDYIKCMTLTPNVDDEIYSKLTHKNISDIKKYIEEPMTATTFNDFNNTKHNSEIVTSELIYYWMISLNIPFECQKWHINKLLTLIRVCNIKNSPAKKMPKKEMLEQRRLLNEKRKRELNSKG